MFVKTKESGYYELFFPSNQQSLHRGTMTVIKKVYWALEQEHLGRHL